MRAMELDLPIRLSDVTALQYKAQLREERSLDYCKWLSCLATERNPDAASRLFLERWPNAPQAHQVQKSLEIHELKSAVPPGSTSGADWGKPIVGVQSLASGFAEIAHSAALLGRLPGLQVIPFGVKVPVETSGATYAWVGEAHVKPISKMAFSNGVTLDVLKALGIVPLSGEFVKLTTRGTDVAMRNTLVNGLVAWQDRGFLDPLSTAIVGVRPASITAGLTPTANTGNLQTDVQSLLNSFFGARSGASPDTVLIANAQKAAQLRALNPGFGLQIIPTEAAGGTVVAVDGRGIYVADGGVMIDFSREASLQLNDAPDDPATASTIQVSLWQTNMVAVRVERTLNFFATPTSVAYLAA